MTITFFLMFNLVKSQTCCSGGVPLSSSIGLDNTTIKNDFNIDLSYDYNNLTTLKSGTKKFDDDSRTRITNSILMNISYAFIDEFSVEILIPYINQKRIISTNQTTVDQSYGIGDLISLFKYNYKKKKYSVIVAGGIKFPTGSTNETNNDGIVLNPDLQPGSGTWDFIVLNSITKKINKNRDQFLTLRFIKNFNGTNKNLYNNRSYKFGSEKILSLSLQDQYVILKKQITPKIDLKYRSVAKDISSNFEQPNTGGNWLFIATEGIVNLTKNLSLRGKFEIPLYSNLNGNQLTTTYRVITGIAYKFNTKKK